jgi:hypothetical protein
LTDGAEAAPFRTFHAAALGVLASRPEDPVREVGTHDRERLRSIASSAR